MILPSQAQLPQVSIGSIRHIESFPSSYVKERNISIWLPPNYDSTKNYPVLYMHDGQMLSDENTTWNKQSWRVDETLGRLILADSIKPCIVVGVWNIPELRRNEYNMQKALSYADSSLLQRFETDIWKRKAISDAYLQFMVKEVKPFIDQNYPTFSDRKNTFISGSSMGGLSSLYAICEYPDVFGAAICLSTHWPGNVPEIDPRLPEAIFSYLEEKLPNPKNHRIYFDHGTATLDSMYAPYQKKVNDIMKTKGFKKSNFKTEVFIGADHSEKAWADRLHVPVLFLLGK